ncbi:proprotein convertase P-domain-containing protein [Krasilnikovia cinnamomea]|uniref:Proprotein convertase P-domain-containing protein n=1 Tax=Krasilnikovia cinnamomea TaxID=349313 RepID=A0A4Q7ZLA1_9ACTN|nr:proprotein convertase P-domain-containing protein [Krasilnikovia cinnamomea]RZU51740.1 proprotein convertase P-domain-containing protein [Krasilnikovia cinnamomea]
MRVGVVASLLAMSAIVSAAPAAAAEPPYSVSATPSTTTIQPGGTVTVAVQTEMSTDRQPVALELSAFTGISAEVTFERPKLTAGESTTMTMRVNPDARSGTHRIEVMAHMNGPEFFTQYATFDLTVTGFTMAVGPQAATVEPGGSATTTITAAGEGHNISFFAPKLPADMTATLSPWSVGEGGTSTLTVQTTKYTPPGTYPIRVVGRSSVNEQESIFTLTIPGHQPGCSGRTDVPVWAPWITTAKSWVNVSGCDRRASSRTTVELHLRGKNVEPLQVVLLTPNGYSRVVKKANYDRHRASLDETFTVDASTEPANGVWELRLFNGDTHSTQLVGWTVNP